MAELKNYRDTIDQLDRELVRLFVERMIVVDSIAEYKKKNNLPVYDKGRESEVLDKVKSYTENESFKEPVARLFTCIMEISKDMQKTRVRK